MTATRMLSIVVLGAMFASSCTTDFEHLFDPTSGGGGGTGTGSTGVLVGSGGSPPPACDPGDLPPPPETGPLLCGDDSGCPMCAPGTAVDLACSYACDVCGAACPLEKCPPTPLDPTETTSSCDGRCSQDTTCSLICDTDTCDFACRDCTRVDYDCNGFDCEASCAGSDDCMLTCGADQCVLEASATASASLACDDGSTSPCQLRCTAGSQCALTAVGHADVTVESASADVSCGAGGSAYCDVRCKAGSTCHVMCHGTDCRISTCEPGSSCVLTCTHMDLIGTPCAEKMMCPGGEPPVGCQNNTFACDPSDCPPDR